MIKKAISYGLILTMLNLPQVFGYSAKDSTENKKPKTEIADSLNVEKNSEFHSGLNKEENFSNVYDKILSGNASPLELSDYVKNQYALIKDNIEIFDKDIRTVHEKGVVNVKDAKLLLSEITQIYESFDSLYEVSERINNNAKGLRLYELSKKDFSEKINELKNIKTKETCPYEGNHLEEFANMLVNKHLLKNEGHNRGYSKQKYVQNMVLTLENVISTKKEFKIEPYRLVPFIGSGEEIDEYVNFDSSLDSFEIMFGVLGAFSTIATAIFLPVYLTSRKSNKKDKENNLPQKNELPVENYEFQLPDLWSLKSPEDKYKNNVPNIWDLKNE